MTQEELVSHSNWRNFGDEKDDHPPMRGWLASPMLDRAGNCLGLIMLSDKYDDKEFDAEDEELLIRIAAIAAAAIELRRSHEDLEVRVKTRYKAEQPALWAPHRTRELDRDGK